MGAFPFNSFGAFRPMPPANRPQVGPRNLKLRHAFAKNPALRARMVARMKDASGVNRRVFR